MNIVLMMKSGRSIIILSLLLLWCVCVTEAQRQPVIGISDVYRDGTNSAVPRSYVDAVLRAGGLPIVIPLIRDNDKIIELLNSLDGVIFTGGEDFDPSYYNERPIPQMGKVNAPRDEFDIRLLRLSVERGLPILGICRGVQLINIVYGGSLYQDLPAQYHDKSIRHRQRQPKEEASHSVLVEDNTVFADIVKERVIMVNSSHHQAIKKVADGFRVAGKSPDQVVEVIEKIDSENWILGVQFHPEVMRDNTMFRIFQHFIEEAGKMAKPYERVRMASLPRQQTRQESIIITPPSNTSYTPIVNKIDTQYIYKLVIDTQYVYTPADTVYISVADKSVDTVYISVADTQYKSADTVYVSVVDTQYMYRPADTVYLTIPEVVEVSPDIKNTVNPIEASKLDTLIYIPGKVDSITSKEVAKAAKIKAKADRKVAKRVEKEALKAAKALEKESKNANNAKSKTDKEKNAQSQKERDKQNKKEQKERDKQNKKEQKEREQQAKKELKEKEAQASKELKEYKEKEKQAKKEAKEKEQQLKKEQKEKAKQEKNA